MDLTFSPEQEELAAAVRRFATEQVTPERLNAWERSADGIDAEFWAAVCGLGWLGIGLPASAGGSGLGLVDVACLLLECSRGLIPTAVSHAIRGAYALAALDPTASELPALAKGQRRVAVAIEEQYVTDPGALAASLVGSSSAAAISGEKWYVPFGAQVDLVLAAVRAGNDVALVLVERRHAEVTPLRTFVGGEPQAILRFKKAPVLRVLTQPGRGRAAIDRMQRHQSVLALAEMIGGMDAALEKTVAYVKEREQFGQKIAVFQAVQHQVADMATAYTAGRHLAWQAITRVATDSDAPLDLPAAAAYVGQAFKQLTDTAHHLHGGAGFVVEHPLHYYSERAQSLCIRYTPEAKALASVAAALLD